MNEEGENEEGELVDWKGRDRSVAWILGAVLVIGMTGWGYVFWLVCLK